ncbi:MAG: 30S ribosome-binding factor RbfA [Lachnospiraceae bacterium]|nr:30S ribosome-binding factor RbfA [Lachnospiraceae bacterium]
MKKNSIKNTRINGEVQKALSEIIRSELKDPRIHPMTSVVLVQVTPDLKLCKAYVSVLGSKEEAKETLLGLRSAEGFIRTHLAKKVNLRNTPEVSFVLDESIEYGVRMTRLIDDVTASMTRENEEKEDEDIGNLSGEA